jgi:spore coat polysaccharide biosynthesis protein SpsF
VIIQARMSSTRLPGKVLMKLDGREVLGHIISRYQRLDFVDKILITTSDTHDDDQISCFAQKNGIALSRGSLENVLDRFYHCATEHSLDLIIRHTADNIFLDSSLLKKAINASKSFDLEKPFIISSRGGMIPIGMDIEVFNFPALALAQVQAQSPYEREHVTPFLYSSDKVLKKSTKNSFQPKSGLPVPTCTLDTFGDLIVVNSYLEWLNGRESTVENCYEWWGAKGA